MKKFNVTGICVPEKHYMVDIGGKIAKIKKMVDDGDHFTINRARQYGKTTTLHELEKKLSGEYTVISITFEELDDESFASSEVFCLEFMELVREALFLTDTEESYAEKWVNAEVKTFGSLGRHITKMCEGRKVVLLIDEVDRTTNNRVFLNFLSVLRHKFLARAGDEDHTFHSVVLAGVHDIKNIKLEMAYNSPWNIAADFKIDMSFDPVEIATMLRDYEADHHTGMDIAAVTGEIHGQTGGYPFLVSRVCQCIDEELDRDWTINGIQNAVQLIIYEQNTLFQDLHKNLENSKKLYDLIYDVLLVGTQRTFSFGNPTINLGFVYGIIQKKNQAVSISNKIFEMVICDYFITKDEESKNKKITGIIRQDILKGGRFDMELCLRKFAEHYEEIYSEDDMKFLERHGRLLFLSYLKPLINGGGYYHIESQFTDLRRMDIVVDYGRDQFIVELKLWRGEQHEREAYEQLLGYMDSKRADTGYLLTFDFRKGAKKQPKAEWVEFGGKKIFDVIV